MRSLGVPGDENVCAELFEVPTKLPVPSCRLGIAPGLLKRLFATLLTHSHTRGRRCRRPTKSGMAETLAASLDASPTVAILAGLPPARAAEVGRALVNAGVKIVEVPLRGDAAAALESVRILADTIGKEAIVGAGTVLTAAQVAEVKAAGARLVVSPNCDAAVIAATKKHNLLSVPGVFTPTEALQAVALGADALKWFPTDGASPRMLKAMLAVLPPGMPVLAVGGVDESNAAEWWAAGARGFGIGSAIWKANLSTAQIGERAERVVAAVDAARRPQAKSTPPLQGKLVHGGSRAAILVGVAVVLGVMLARKSIGRMGP